MSRCARQCGGGRSSVANTFHLKSSSACGNKYEKLICGSFSEFNLWTWVYLLTYLRKIYFCSTLKLVKHDDCDLGWWWTIDEENGVVIEIWSMTQPTIHPPALSHTFHILQNSEIQSRDSIEHSTFIEKWKGAMNLKWNATRGKDTF